MRKIGIINELKHLITCMKCEVSGKCCDENCPTQYEAGNMGEIIKNLEEISKILEQEPCEDTISRQAAIDELDKGTWGVEWDKTLAKTMIESLPSAQPEQLTDKEQRIFLAAMGREEKVCKQVDEECRDCREAYEDSLVKTCHEIIRKVKGALWT